MINAILKILFLYIPALYGYWVFIFLVFIDDSENQAQTQRYDSEIAIVKKIQIK